MKRRSLLFGTTSFFGLAACAGTDQTVKIVATDVQLIANGLQGILPNLGTLAGLSPESLATIANALADLQQVASAIAQTSTTAEEKPLVQKVEAYVNTIVSILAAIPLIPPPISTVLQAAAILLPIIETAVGLVVQNPPRVRGGTPMTADQARLILGASAAKVQR